MLHAIETTSGACGGRGAEPRLVIRILSGQVRHLVELVSGSHAHVQTVERWSQRDLRGGGYTGVSPCLHRVGSYSSYQ